MFKPGQAMLIQGLSQRSQSLRQAKAKNKPSQAKF